MLDALHAQPPPAAPSTSGDRPEIRPYIKHLYAQWNKQTFLQGNVASGTYNARTHHYALAWHTLVHGGPFDGYTGYWYLKGTFSP